MSIDSTLRGLAAEIGKNRNPTGSVAAPAKLRHRTGTIDAYTAGSTTASVLIGADVVDAPFIATYTPVAGDAVSILLNNGSPLILGAVNKVPAAVGGAVAARGAYSASAWDGTYFDTLSLSDDLLGIGAYITVVAGGSLLMAAGWYQVQGTFKADGLTAGNVCAGFVDVQDAGTLNDNPNNSVVVPPGLTGSGLFTATSAPFYTAGGGDTLRIGLSCYGGTPSFTTASLFVVRLA